MVSVIEWCWLATSDSEGQDDLEGTPRSYHEFLLQLSGAGWLVLQGPACKGVPSRAQKVESGFPGCVHRADGLHGPEGPHIQHQSYVGAPPVGRANQCPVSAQ